MRSEFGPLLIDGTLAVAGLSILFAVGLVPRGIWVMLGALGLGYMTGAAAIPVLLTALITIGIPFTLVTYLIIVLACIGCAFLRLRLRPVPSAERRAWKVRSWRSLPPTTWIVVSFVVLFGGYALVGLLSAFEMPLSAWDAWTIWGRKAQLLTVHDSLVPGYFTQARYVFSHVDYPLQLPIWEALHFRARGGFFTPIILRHVWVFLIAFVWGVAYLMRKRVNPIVWAPLLLLVAVAPGVWQQLLSGYADIPVAMFGCLGALLLASWLDKGEPGLLAVAAIMLAAAANTKNEGLAIAVAMLVAAGVIALLCRLKVSHLLIAAAAVVAASLPWRIWTAANGIKGDLQLPSGLNPVYLWDHFDRVRPSIEAINHQLAAQGSWVYLLPLASLVVAACIWSGVGRRLATFYLASFTMVWIVFIWVYWTSLYELSWYLRFSADRIVDSLVFICVAALLHLSGVLVGSLGTRRSQPGAESTQ